MGYNIYIGNAIIQYNNSYKDETVDVEIERAIVKNAPEFGFNDISGKSNGRHPSYSGMSDFAEAVGLTGLFFEEDEGLLRPHPGVKAISADDLSAIRQAKKQWESTHPNCKNELPTKDKEPANIKDLGYLEKSEAAGDYDWYYARLIWFEFWFYWALNNCQYPAIGNG